MKHARGARCRQPLPPLRLIGPKLDGHVGYAALLHTVGKIHMVDVVDLELPFHTEMKLGASAVLHAGLLHCGQGDVEAVMVFALPIALVGRVSRKGGGGAMLRRTGDLGQAAVYVQGAEVGIAPVRQRLQLTDVVRGSFNGDEPIGGQRAEGCQGGAASPAAQNPQALLSAPFGGIEGNGLGQGIDAPAQGESHFHVSRFRKTSAGFGHTLLQG